MTLHGIDVSHWQSGLQLAKTDAQFALFKATDGTSYVDATCNGFVTQAKKLGIPWGVYHFWQGNPTAEADHFVDSVAGYIGHGVLALDFEGDHAVSASAAKTFLDRVHTRTGVRPLIYMSQSVTQRFDWSAVARDYGLWVARYNESIGPTGAWDTVTIWQYTDAHHTGGMNVDGDRFYGDRAAWAALAAGSAAADTTDTDDTDDTSSGDDDMPAWKNAGYGTDWNFTADGEWHTIPVETDDDGGKVYSALWGPAYATGELYLSLTGLAKGHEVDTRFVLADVKSGAATEIAGEGSTVEHGAISATTSLAMPFTSYVTKASKSGWSRRLRFQVRAYGGDKVTVQGARVRFLYWKR